MIVFDSMRERGERNSNERERDYGKKTGLLFSLPTLWSFMNTGKNIEIKRRKTQKVGERVSWRSANVHTATKWQ